MAKSATNLRIVTIGGGTGAPTIIRSLVLAGFTNLSCISAVTDSGGKTGFIRTDERDRVIAISDLFRNLLSLLPTGKNSNQSINAFTDLINYTDGRNRNLGYLIYYGLLEKYQGNFLAIQNHLERLLSKKFAGSAIPVTAQPTNICFSTKNKTVFKGEHELDRQIMSKNTIRKIWLEPPVPATTDAITAVASATHLIYCPGSLYGSVLANFLPIGIQKALKQNTKAHKILITNLVSNRNQTHHFTPLKYFQIFHKYTRLSQPFDTIIVPRMSPLQFNQLYPQIASFYQAEHAHYLGWNKSQLLPLRHKGVKIVSQDIFTLSPSLNRLRHDPAKLAKILRKIIK